MPEAETCEGFEIISRKDWANLSAEEAEETRKPISHSFGEVIYSEEVELEIQKLSRWRPQVIIDRRTIEASQEGD